MARPLKADSAEFAAALRRHGRQKPAFHWTPLSNLRGILQRGILCRSRLQTLGLKYTRHGYGTAGKEAQFGEYVCISLYPQKGMMQRATEPQALFEVRPELIYVEGVFYCPGNSAKNEYQFDDLVQKTTVADLDELFEGPNEWRLKDWQAEIWVPGYIAAGDIVRVNFANERIRDQAVDLCKDITGSLPKDFEFAVGADWHFPEPPELEPEVPDDEAYELEEEEDPFDAIVRENYLEDLDRRSDG